jgi:hypothetical protein
MLELLSSKAILKMVLNEIHYNDENIFIRNKEVNIFSLERKKILNLSFSNKNGGNKYNICITYLNDSNEVVHDGKIVDAPVFEYQNNESHEKMFLLLNDLKSELMIPDVDEKDSITIQNVK